MWNSKQKNSCRNCPTLVGGLVGGLVVGGAVVVGGGVVVVVGAATTCVEFSNWFGSVGVQVATPRLVSDEICENVFHGMVVGAMPVFRVPLALRFGICITSDEIGPAKVM